MSAPNWFVALPVVAPTAIEALGTPPPSVRAFHPADLHLTLAFFGAVDERAAKAGWDALELGLAPRDVVLGDVIALGNPRRPSALSARIEQDALTHAIGTTRGPMLSAAAAPLETRPPLAHVTLARIGRRASETERRVAIDWAAGLTLAAVPARIERVALYTWSADRRERLFRIVASRPLV